MDIDRGWTTTSLSISYYWRGFGSHFKLTVAGFKTIIGDAFSLLLATLLCGDYCLQNDWHRIIRIPYSAMRGVYKKWMLVIERVLFLSIERENDLQWHWKKQILNKKKSGIWNPRHVDHVGLAWMKKPVFWSVVAYKWTDMGLDNAGKGD